MDEVEVVRTVNHRELRNLSGEILRDVKAGQVIEVTNRGEPMAILMPPSGTPYDRLAAAGKVRLASDRVNLTKIPRQPGRETSAEIIADLRGDR